jgi:hypothetical protein
VVLPVSGGGFQKAACKGGGRGSCPNVVFLMFIIALGSLPLKPLCQPFLVVVFFFYKIGSQELFAKGWLQTSILLIFVSRVARNTGVSHRCLATFLNLEGFDL